MSTSTVDLGSVPSSWKRRHLLGLEELSAEEITLILDKAEVFRQAMDAGERRIPLLTGRTCVNLFFEDSTRTRNSFSLAARYRIRDLTKLYVEIHDHESTIQNQVSAAAAQAIAGLTVPEFEAGFQEAVEKEARKRLTKWGVSLLEVSLFNHVEAQALRLLDE